MVGPVLFVCGPSKFPGVAAGAGEPLVGGGGQGALLEEDPAGDRLFHGVGWFGSKSGIDTQAIPWPVKIHCTGPAVQESGKSNLQAVFFLRRSVTSLP